MPPGGPRDSHPCDRGQKHLLPCLPPSECNRRHPAQAPGTRQMNADDGLYPLDHLRLFAFIRGCNGLYLELDPERRPLYPLAQERYHAHP